MQEHIQVHGLRHLDEHHLEAGALCAQGHQGEQGAFHLQPGRHLHRWLPWKRPHPARLPLRLDLLQTELSWGALSDFLIFSNGVSKVLQFFSPIRF